MRQPCIQCRSTGFHALATRLGQSLRSYPGRSLLLIRRRISQGRLLNDPLLATFTAPPCRNDSDDRLERSRYHVGHLVQTACQHRYALPQFSKLGIQRLGVLPLAMLKGIESFFDPAIHLLQSNVGVIDPLIGVIEPTVDLVIQVVESPVDVLESPVDLVIDVVESRVDVVKSPVDVLESPFDVSNRLSTW